MPRYWFDHVHLNSPDFLKTANFYEEMFGAKRIVIRELTGGRTMTALALNGTEIKITQPKAQMLVATPAGNGLDHFGLRTDNIELAVEGLKAKGVKFVQEITEVRPGDKVSFFLGPEDVLIDLAQMGS